MEDVSVWFGGRIRMPLTLRRKKKISQITYYFIGGVRTHAGVPYERI